MTEEENSVRVRTPTKKSSVAVYFVLMLFGCVAVGMGSEAMGINAYISWGLVGLLLLGAIYWCFTLERKHKEKHPKKPWEKARTKRIALITSLALGIPTVLAFAGLHQAAGWFVCLALIGGGVCVLFLWAYGLVEPHAKDRKSAIKLAIILILVVAGVAYGVKQAERPVLENHQSTDGISLQDSFDRMTPQQYQAILKMMSPQKRQESIESLSRSQRERLLPD